MSPHFHLDLYIQEFDSDEEEKHIRISLMDRRYTD